jgi:phosphoribosylformimino-5-aminoimidazole carboxamide ribotide isomerase
MDLYPRVHILGGKAVRLPKGDIREAISLDASAVSRARSWISKGAERLHVVDLDAAAYLDYQNRELIREIIEDVDVPVQVAGGIRSTPEVGRLLDDLGAWRIVMGTAAIEDQVLIWDLCRKYPGKIMVAIDVNPNEEVATRGWQVNSGRYLEEVLIELSSAGAAGFVVSEVRRDALVEHSNVGILRHAMEIVTEPIIAGGGARDVADLQSLIDLEVDGRHLSGVIVGREITEGRFTLEEANEMMDGV